MTISWADLFAPPKKETSAPVMVSVQPGADPYGAAALRAEIDRVNAAIPGTRNDALNRAAFSLAQLVDTGRLDRIQVETALFTAAQSIGLSPAEIRGTLHSAFRGGAAKPRPAIPDQTPLGTVERLDLTQIKGSDKGLDNLDLWGARPILTHIRDFALSRMCSPAAVLGVTILRALAITPPTVVLPPTIGGVGSLNLFCALVGPSGAGKGAAESAARDAFIWPTEIFIASTGSGEGIAHCYAHIEKGEQIDDRQSVLFSIPEIDSLSAISSRQGSTLLSQLRSAFSGERLGFSYADRSRRLLLDRHQYRLGVIVGVQPERAQGLLADSDGGTPQRFVWLPATDKNISRNPPPEPAPMTVRMPRWAEETQINRIGQLVIPIPDEVTLEVRTHHAARARGEGQALDGHALFAREKVAVALAVLDGRAHMTLDDWRLSGAIMQLSTQTRESITHTLTDAKRRERAKETELEIERLAAIEDASHAKRVMRVRSSIERLLTTGGRARSDVYRAIYSADRSVFGEALEMCLGLGTVTETGGVLELSTGV